VGIAHLGLIFSLRFINNTRGQAGRGRAGKAERRPVRKTAAHHAGTSGGQAGQETAHRQEREKATTRQGQERVHPQKLLSLFRFGPNASLPRKEGDGEGQSLPLSSVTATWRRCGSWRLLFLVKREEMNEYAEKNTSFCCSVWTN
jgi:hypothetical protein